MAIRYNTGTREWEEYDPDLVAVAEAPDDDEDDDDVFDDDDDNGDDDDSDDDDDEDEPAAEAAPPLKVDWNVFGYDYWPPILREAVEKDGSYEVHFGDGYLSFSRALMVDGHKGWFHAVEDGVTYEINVSRVSYFAKR